MHVSQVMIFLILSSVSMVWNALVATSGLYQEKVKREIIMTDIQKASIKKGEYTYSYILSNGLTVIVREQHTIPKVSIQMWYNVGSKDEQIGHKGIAHFIEHLIFKGTSGKVGASLNLSESDINMIAHKLSGYINAFTSYDYTGYLFNMPTQHYKEVFSIIADCMNNAKFDDQMINSEMKAVIQELKMRRDNYPLSLIEQMMGVLFQDHPYHYPIIGYKSDLWSVSSQELRDFYTQHYVPNNATLVVAGDVQHEEVFVLAEEYFGNIPAKIDYKKRTFVSHPDIESKSVTLYREVQQPLVQFAFVVPGLKEKTDVELEILSWIVGQKRSSRLHKILVEEMQIATAVSSWHWDLFDYSMFGIGAYPKDQKDIQQIEAIIAQELLDIAQNGFSDWEFTRAIKNTEMDLHELFENIQEQASTLGQSYLATGDAEYVFTMLDNIDELRTKTHNLVKNYIRPALMNKGYLFNLPETEIPFFKALQEKSDAEDEAILSARVRTSAIESISHAQNVAAKNPTEFQYPKPVVSHLSNGIKILSHAHKYLKRAEIRLSLKSKWYYDPEDKQGLYNFVSDMLLEGTKNYTQEQLSQEIESRGMSVSSYIGGISISLLPEDIPFGLELLHELVTNARFEAQHIEKVRAQIFARIKQVWDNPRAFSDKLLNATMYEGHPYHKDALGDNESIAAIDRNDLIDFYKKYYSPDGAKIAIVGDIGDVDISALCEQTIAAWQGGTVPTITFPELQQKKNQEIKYPINRDQVVLTLAQLSVNRTHPDYDKLVIFDQIFGGGALGSMASRLFALREATGLFYGISGSLVAGATEEKGMFKIKTIVSLDRLQEAIDVIKKTITSVAEAITEQEVLEAKRAIVNTQVDHFQTSTAIASVFLFLDRYNLPFDYFDARMQTLESITVEEIKQAVRPFLQIDDLVTLEVGRV